MKVWTKRRVERNDAVVCDGPLCGKTIRWPALVYQRERADKTLEELCHACRRIAQEAEANK